MNSSDTSNIPIGANVKLTNGNSISFENGLYLANTGSSGKKEYWLEAPLGRNGQLKDMRYADSSYFKAREVFAIFRNVSEAEAAGYDKDTKEAIFYIWSFDEEQRYTIKVNVQEINEAGNKNNDKVKSDNHHFKWWLSDSIGKQIVAVGHFDSKFDGGGGSNWSLKVRDTVYQVVDKPIVSGETVLLIVKMEYGTPNKVSFYINPDDLNGIEPLEPDVFVETEESISFKHIGYYGGFGDSNSPISQLRLGDSYKAVTPTVSALIDIVDVGFDENNHLKNISLGNYTGQNLPAAFIAAMYDRKKNELVKTEVVEDVLLAKDSFKKVEFEQDLYYDDEYSLKIFIWDNLENMTPLSEERIEY